MTQLCQRVSLSLLSAVLLVGPVGCAQSHVVEGGAVDGGLDAAVARDSGRDALVLPDAPLFPDSGLPDCRNRGHFLCLEHRVIEAAEPFVLPIQFDGCLCPNARSCAVSVGRSGVISLETELCDFELCGECEPNPTVECEVGGLPAGTWRLDVNGAPAGTIEIGPADGDAREPWCLDFAEPDSCSVSTPVPGDPDRFDGVCVRRGVGNSAVLWVEDVCGECPAYDGPCNVRFQPRTERDMPPGFEIFFDARIYSGACDGPCDGVCTFEERMCPLPPLNEADFYRVFVEGEDAPRFQFFGGELGLCG